MTMVTPIKELDRQFEAFLDNVLFSVTKKDMTQDKRIERRERADRDDLEFCKIYFPNIFKLEWNALHYVISNLIRGNYTVSGFRYSGKTAFTFVSKVIKLLCKDIGGIINVSTRTQEKSEERTAALIRIIRGNRLLQYDYDITIHQDKKGYYIVNNTILLATSVNVGLRGYVSDEFKRFKISINDDLYDRTTVNSELDNKKVVDFITAEVYGQMEDDGLSITLGNSITENCPIMQMKEMFPDSHFGLPALNKDGESNWPEHKTKEDWEKKRRDTAIDVWEGDYMDRPYERGDIFQREWLRTININTLEILATISAADPAHGTSPSACMKSIATVSATSKQEVVMEDMYLRREDYEKFFDYVDALRSKLPKWKILLFENDFNQWGFAQPYYLNWMGRTKKTIPILQHLSKDLKTEHRGADKESRLLNLVHPHQTGMFLYNQNIKGNPDYLLYVSQYLAFGKSKTKLDGLDAAATAYIMIFRYISQGSFKPLKTHLFKRAKQRMFKR